MLAMPKICKSLPAAGFWAVLAAAAGWRPAPVQAQVSGRIEVTDAGGRRAQDLGNAVVYLDGEGPRAAPARVDMSLDARQFHPRVVVVGMGSTVNFPNLDPFNHNVFSLSDPNDFDLGLYSSGTTHRHRFRRPGLVRVYCNIHPRMTGFVVVMANAWYTQPGADGTFTIPDVPPGTYTLRVWHERAPDFSRQITVPAGGLSGLTVSLDASTYVYVQHKNKYGRDYGSGSTRERY